MKSTFRVTVEMLCVMPEARKVFLSHTSELSRLPGRRPSWRQGGGGGARRGCRGGHAHLPRLRDQARPGFGGWGTGGRRVRGAGGVPLRHPGPIPPELSYTELEFEAATAAGMPRLVFLLADDSEGPRELFAELEHPKRQEAFRQRVRSASGVTIDTVASPEELSEKLFQALTACRGPARRACRLGGCGACRPVTRGSPGGRNCCRATEALGRGGSAVVQAVHGMGGIGKTTLALEYAHRFGDEYDVVWWVPAEDPALVPDRLAELARSLGLQQ